MIDDRALTVAQTVGEVSSTMPKGATGRAAPMDNASGILRYWAGASPSVPALIAGATTTTYAALHEHADRLAKALVDRGVRSGDRVAIVGENDAGVVAALFASWAIGACAIPLNARYTARELDTILAHAAPRLTLFVAPAASAAHDHAARVGASEAIAPELSIVTGPLQPVATEVMASEAGERLALILYTSGTTGAPKGVMLPHRAVLAMADLWAETRAVEPGDLVYQVLPMSHSYGLNSLLVGALNRGCTVRLDSRFTPEALADAFAAGTVVFQGVPAMYARYLAYVDASGTRHHAPRLTSISTGGAPLDPELKARVEEKFKLQLRQAYGLTEAGPTVTAPMPEINDARSLGREIPGIEVRVVDGETGQDVASGAAGELWVRGPGVMLGYFRDSAATKAALTADGWLRTGDIVSRGPRGDLLIAGRSRDIIIRSGFNVHPPEVEAVLCAHPAVRAAAVVGRPAANADEDVIAFVELRAGFARTLDLTGHCAERLAGYKRPNVIVILEELPLNLSGKVATAVLNSMATTV